MGGGEVVTSRRRGATDMVAAGRVGGMVGLGCAVAGMEVGGGGVADIATAFFAARVARREVLDIFFLGEDGRKYLMMKMRAKAMKPVIRRGSRLIF